MCNHDIYHLNTKKFRDCFKCIVNRTLMYYLMTLVKFTIFLNNKSSDPPSQLSKRSYRKDYIKQIRLIMKQSQINNSRYPR